MQIEDETGEATTSTASDTAPETSQPDPAAVVQRDQEGARKSIKDHLLAAVEKHKGEPSPARQAAAAQRARDNGKFAPEDGKEKPQQIPAKVEPGAKSATVPDAAQVPPKEAKSAPAIAPQAPAAAPSSLSKETRAIWDTLPEVVRSDIIKREGDTARGVEQLKSRYQPIDEALAPMRPLLQQFGKSEGDAIKQLFGWHQALSGPNKAQAFQALARSHGFDLATLAQGPGQQPTQDPNDPRIAVQQALQGYVAPLEQRLSQWEQQMQQERLAKVTDELSSFSKDKPHFERVRIAMGQMMTAGYATSLDDAYQKATWADPEIRTQILAEESAKRDAEAKAAQDAEKAKQAAETEARRKAETEAAAKARKANVSVRGSTPTGSSSPARAGTKSIRESIVEAVQGSRASV